MWSLASDRGCDILAAMAGLVAVISGDGHSPVPRAELDSLIRAYEHVRGTGRVHVASAGEFALCAKIEGPVGGGIDQDRGGWCASVGKIHTRHRGPRAPLADLDGQFAAVRFDEAGARLELISDPFGMQSLYVADRDGRIYASSSATALARHLKASPDPLGAALFLRTGRQFGPLTHWHGIRRLDPATVITVDRSGHTESIYWRPTVDERVRAMSLKETIDHCAYAVLSTVEANLADEPCMKADLTGGFDSRLVTAALARLGMQFTAQTSGETETIDVRLAREVAEAGGFDWHQERLPLDWQPDTDALRSAMGWSDGMLEVLQLSEVLWLQQRRRESCELVVTGGGGEHFGPQPWLQEFLRAGRSRQINWDNYMSMRALTPEDLSVLRTDPTEDVELYMREALSERASAYSDELNTTQLDIVYAYRTVGHFGAYRAASEAFVRSELPPYYKGLFSAGFSAHHRFRNGHRLHRGVIGRINPTMGAVETERGGPAQRMRLNNAHRFAPYYWRLGRTAVNKVRGRKTTAAPEGPAQSGYRHAIRSMREDGLLDPSTMRSGEVFDATKLSALLDRAEQPHFGGWGMLGRVATLELSLRSVDGASLSSLRS